MKDKTMIFWCSDWLDPPLFESRVNRNWFSFLGVPMDTKGKIPSSELNKIVSNIRRQIGMWSSIKLSLLERATILKMFICSRLVYILSLMPASNRMITNLQKEINMFFWNKKHPSISFKTCVGRRGDGGFGLIDLNTIITSLRIKCGLKIIDSSPTLWKFYACQHVGLVLRIMRHEFGQTWFHISMIKCFFWWGCSTSW